ncbi:molybdenum cofactor guanylyltransferase MobA [Oceanomicrobium pacificus]|uniref:Molybdenum cofactor guanylyltransferase n=1 Tax=Oceanomicrobium pacificus TaxID=2692916 RepID=A0A6B0TSP6_9RHOB|nr:molybdenum cofactor guanylyltransferase MobA [Oceanomicrobium pacificus]MXU64013.1 molybdenum cofactor guanylyltransferase MobA [Oceanomicrobium pacificus]
MTGVAGVILAGGAARRMGGGDKGLLALGDRPVLAHVIDRLAPQVKRLALNANGPAERFASFGLPVVADSLPDRPGPLAGVLAGLDWAAAAGFGQIVTAAADTPFLPAHLVDALRMAQVSKGTPIAMAATEGRDADGAPRHDRHPTFALWPVALRDDLRAALLGGTRKVIEWSDRHGCAEVVFHGDADPFFNINRPADLEAARARLADGETV